MMIRNQQDHQNVVAERQKQKGRIDNAQQQRSKVSDVQEEQQNGTEEMRQVLLWTSLTIGKQPGISTSM